MYSQQTPQKDLDSVATLIAELSSNVKELLNLFEASKLTSSEQFAGPANLQESSDPTFSIQELASYLRCSIQTVHNLKREGELPYYRIARQVYFKKSEIDSAARITSRQFGKTSSQRYTFSKN